MYKQMGNGSSVGQLTWNLFYLCYNSQLLPLCTILSVHYKMHVGIMQLSLKQKFRATPTFNNLKSKGSENGNTKAYGSRNMTSEHFLKNKQPTVITIPTKKFTLWQAILISQY